MILKNFIIFKNEPCPCGSLKMYKDCCYYKADSNFDATHLQKIMQDLSKGFNSCKFEVCLHPNHDECIPPIKHAHSIQNHGILSQISVKNHVRAIRTDKDKNIMKATKINEGTINIQFLVDSVGVNEATTHTCFCNFHDSTVFSPIESSPNGFQGNNSEQLFIFAYKAFAFEYYKTKVATLSIQKLYKTIPNKLKKFPFLIVPHYRSQQLKAFEMEYYKTFFDNGLLHKDYTKLTTKLIEIPYKIAFTTVDCIAPMFSIKGRRIRNIIKHSLRRLFLTIFPNKTSSYILISYLIDDCKNYEDYVNDLMNLNQADLFCYLSVFLPLYSENLVISPKLWDKWGIKGQTAFNSLINTIEKDAIKNEFELTSNINILLKKEITLPEVSCNLFERVYY